MVFEKGLAVSLARVRVLTRGSASHGVQQMLERTLR
jgi:hypothetical protein